MVLEDGLPADELELDCRGDPADLEPERQGLLVARREPRRGDRDEQLPVCPALLYLRIRHAHGHVVGRRLVVREKLEPHLLREFRERVAEAAPDAILRRPVVLPLVGADPDLRGAGPVLHDVVVDRLHEHGNVGRGGRGAGDRQVSDLGGPRQLDRLRRRVGEQHAARGAERLQRLDELAAAGLELGVGSFAAPLLHRRRAVEDHDGEVRTGAAGEGQPAARQRPADGEEQGRDGRHPHRHDQPVPQPRVAAGQGLGRHQEHHRRPGHGLEPALVDEVDDERQAHQRQGREHQRLEEVHRSPFPAARATRNRASTCS